MLKKTLLVAFAMTAAMPVVGRPAAAQELDEVLAHYYDAIGGLDAWKAIESTRMTGKMVMMGGFEAPFTIMSKRPGKARLEFTFQGMTGIQAFDGETAWMVMPFMGSTEPEEMPADLSKQLAEQADVDGPLVGWEEDGHQVELLGKEDVEGTETYKLKVTLDGGDISYFFLDAEHYLPIKVSAKRSLQGMEAEVETFFGDYKEVGGLMMAHSIEVKTSMGGMGDQTITIDQAEIDVALDDTLFTMPDK